MKKVAISGSVNWRGKGGRGGWYRRVRECFKGTDRPWPAFWAALYNNPSNPLNSSADGLHGHKPQSFPPNRAPEMTESHHLFFEGLLLSRIFEEFQHHSIQTNIVQHSGRFFHQIKVRQRLKSEKDDIHSSLLTSICWIERARLARARSERALKGPLSSHCNTLVVFGSVLSRTRKYAPRILQAKRKIAMKINLKSETIIF